MDKFTVGKDVIAKIRKHAIENYNTGGWDYLVECYSDGDIVLLVAECDSYEACIAKLAKLLKSKDDYRSEIQSTAF